MRFGLMITLCPHAPPVTTLLAVAATWAAMKLRDKNKEEAALKETTKAPSSSSQAGGDMRQPKSKEEAVRHTDAAKAHTEAERVHRERAAS